jgi:hypothetical protein
VLEVDWGGVRGGEDSLKEGTETETGLRSEWDMLGKETMDVWG